jgi:hypothetical protein
VREDKLSKGAMGRFLRWTRNVMLLVVLLKVYHHPHSIGWLFVFGGWFIHSQLYETAIAVFQVFTPQEILAWRGMALVHTYMGNCDEAMRIYDREIIPHRLRLYTLPETTTTGEASFVWYRPHEISDYVRIYGDCAGRTEQTFALTEDAHQRWGKSIRARTEPTPAEELTLTGIGSNFLYDLALLLELTQTFKLRQPFAFTQLVVIPTHETYLALLARYLPTMQFSHTPANLFRHGWRADTLWSAFFVAQAADYLGVGWAGARPWHLLGLAGGATWRFWSIFQARHFLHSMGNIMKKHDAQKDPRRKLSYLELARRRMIHSPTHPLELWHGLGVAVVGEAIQSLIFLGDTEQVDRLVPIVVELWEAKRGAEMQNDDHVRAGDHKGMIEAFVHEIFVTAPAKVRWVAGDITVEKDYLERIAQHQKSWELRKMARNSTLSMADQPLLSALS